MCYGTNCGREGAFGTCYHPEDCIERALDRDAEENLAARLVRDTALSREHFPCPDSCISIVLTCATPSEGRTICAMERPCFGSTLRTASIIAVRSAYLRLSFPSFPTAAVEFFSAGSSSPCAAARAFASSLICSLWVSHIYLLPAFFRFRVLAPVPRKPGSASRKTTRTEGPSTPPTGNGSARSKRRTRNAPRNNSPALIIRRGFSFPQQEIV